MAQLFALLSYSVSRFVLKLLSPKCKHLAGHAEQQLLKSNLILEV